MVPRRISQSFRRSNNYALVYYHSLCYPPSINYREQVAQLHGELKRVSSLVQLDHGSPTPSIATILNAPSGDEQQQSVTSELTVLNTSDSAAEHGKIMGLGSL